MSAARLVSIAVALACLALGGWLALGHRDERRLEQAQAALDAGRSAPALAKAMAASGQAAGRATVVRAYAATAEGRYVEAHRAFRAARRRDPNNWLLARDDAVVLLALGRRSQARREMRRALALNPRLDLPPGFVAR